jgi:hypothetical protein
MDRGPATAAYRANQIIRCTESCSDVHITCLSPCGELVLTALEAKKLAGGATEQDITDGLHRLAVFMVSTVALSQWGLGMKPGAEPIVGLLVFPSAIFRLSIWKPSDGIEVPFGLEHRVERTSDPLMMGWVLERFLRDYEADYRRLKPLNLSYESPRPVLWSPINYDLERGLVPLRVTAPTNLGFLFRTNAKNLGLLIEKQQIKLKVDAWDEIPADEELIAKYLSSLLVVPPRRYSQPIEVLVQNSITSKRNLKLEEGLLNELSELNHSYAKLLRKHVQVELERAHFKKNESKALELAEIQEIGLKGQAEVQNEMAKRQARIIQLKSTTTIKHPYIDILQVRCFGKYHPLLIMRDMGVSLADAMKDTAFLSRWRVSQELRRRFGADVGESALNLVEMPSLGLCHNDIWAPNIAVKDGASFCLIDFDLAAWTVHDGASACPVLRDILHPEDELMTFSVAQIALVVFALDVDAPRGAVERLRRYWLRGAPSSRPDIPEFEAWLAGKGPLVADVFSCSPAAGCETRKQSHPLSRDHYVGILDAMLK